MRVPPLNLHATSAVGAANGGATNDRLSLPPSLFSPDLLWRYQLSPFGPAAAAAAVAAAQHQQQQQLSTPPAPSTPHSPAVALELRSQLPHQLPTDPRMWVREEVAMFLQWCESEFDLPSINVERLKMNGKALCMLNKADLNERAPGAGDLVHNALQLLLVADCVAATGGVNGGATTCRLPASPLTPQSLPTSSVSPSWNSVASSLTTTGPASHLDVQHQLHHHHPHHHHQQQQHLQHAVSVTLSPASSASSESQCASPQLQSGLTAGTNVKCLQTSSDSEDVNGGSLTAEDVESPRGSPQLSPPPLQCSAFPLAPPSSSTSSLSSSVSASSVKQLSLPLSLITSVSSAAESHRASVTSSSSTPSSTLSQLSPTLPAGDCDRTSSCSAAVTGVSTSESGSGGGRLLWDFLQQLLNDPLQRFVNLIAWRNVDTGVFKIVDPQGLARLWGVQKNHLSMNYDKMSRALRYYYRVNILRKVQGERHCYQFLRSPLELKSLKLVSLRSMAGGGGGSASSGVKLEPRSPTLLQQHHQNQQQHQHQPAVRSCVGEKGSRSGDGGEQKAGLQEDRESGGSLHHHDQDSPTDLSLSNNVHHSVKRSFQDDIESFSNLASIHRRTLDDDDEENVPMDADEVEEEGSVQGPCSSRLCIDLSSSTGSAGSPSSAAEMLPANHR